MKKFYLVLFLIFLLVGCSDIGNPTPREVLKEENADIFLMNEVVYAKAIDIDWVTESEYTIREEVAEISKQQNRAIGFNNGTANILPVGTKIYETGQGFVIAIVGEKEVPYIALLEG